MFVINFNDLFTYFGGPKPPQEFEYVRWIKMKRKKKHERILDAFWWKDFKEV